MIITGINDKMTYRVYDKDGQLKRIISKFQEKQIGSDEWLRGVSCFVINEKQEILIERRVNKGLTPGKLDLCSGHLDNGEVPTQAMLRELKEELGINIEEAINVRRITKEPAPLVFESLGKTKNFFIDFYSLKIAKPEKIEFQEKEIQEILWFPMEEVFELIRQGKTKFPKDYDYEEIFDKVRELLNNKEKNIDEK